MPLPARLMLPHGRLIGFLVTAVVSLLLLILPVYNNGRTLFNVNGSRAFAALSIPVMITPAPLAFDRLGLQPPLRCRLS
jgi:hypothetical protein